MAKKTPLQQVKDLFGGKEKLVDKLIGMLDRADESKDEFRDRLLAIPNSKLLRLHEITAEIKEKFGTKEKMVDAILDLMKRAKDNDYREKLQSFTPNKLMDMYRSWLKKASKAA